MVFSELGNPTVQFGAIFSEIRSFTVWFAAAVIHVSHGAVPVPVERFVYGAVPISAGKTIQKAVAFFSTVYPYE